MQGRIEEVGDGRVNISLPAPFLEEIRRQNIHRVDVYIPDGRRLSDKQRKKIFATIGDVSLWCGQPPEDLRILFTWDYCMRADEDIFSLSPRKNNVASMDTARGFITYLLDFCLYHGVPLSEGIMARTDDQDRALYLCMWHRKCCICGRKADIHHVDAIGMGRDRDTIIHTGLPGMALCRAHHTEAEGIGKNTFEEKYHVWGIRMDEALCRHLGLNTRRR